MKKSNTLNKPVNESVNIFKDFIDGIKSDFKNIGTEFKSDLIAMFDETKETGKQIQKDAQEIIDDACLKLEELKKGYQDKL